MKVELVVIEGYYAIRRSRFFGLFRDFLNFETSTVNWEPRDYNYFKNCLIDDLVRAKRALARFGSNYGTPYVDGIIPINEFMEMTTMAEKDEGMKDLLMQAREFYLLKKKG